MKSIFLTFIAVLGLAITVIAQTPPKGFKYQAIVYDNLGVAISNKSVSIRLSILKGGSSGTAVYMEKHLVTTNGTGQVNLTISEGSLLLGDFTTINWGSDSYFLKVEMDKTGGRNFALMGVSQLQSVPYALYSAKSGSSIPGPIGATGATGTQGVKGDVGTKGDIGVTGAKGDIGATGAKGDTGATGTQGDRGLVGSTGATGETGAKGDTGVQGDRGLVGSTGTTGVNGTTGVTGATGATGAKGATGVTGVTGATGIISARLPLEIVSGQIQVGNSGAYSANQVLAYQPNAINDEANWVAKSIYVSYGSYQPKTINNMQPSLGLNYCIATEGIYPSRGMCTEPYIGSLGIFAGNFAPRGWALCQGQLISIAQNTALFSILGTTYGGDGRTTFALPDLRGRVILGVGQGPGLSNEDLGEMNGVESTTFDAASHTHTTSTN